MTLISKAKKLINACVVSVQKGQNVIQRVQISEDEDIDGKHKTPD